jgi:hypothetical protein
MSGIVILVSILLGLLVTSVCIGIINAREVNVYVDANTSYYNIGISHKTKKMDSFSRIDQLTIGLGFININVWFIKDIEA